MSKPDIKIYFASDQHFGAPNPEKSKLREHIFVQWLDDIKKEATHLFLLGDLFDFWFEYNTVVPKGFVRILGKLAELSDAGIKLRFFVGNHDLWMKDYFEKELQIPVYHKPKTYTFGDKKFFIGHGDGLGPGDKSFKRMKKVFVHPVSKFLYKCLHPDLGVKLGQYLSLKNRYISGEEDLKYQGDDKEMLVQYCQKIEAASHHDYYIFGHRHLPLEIPISKNSIYINTGDWIKYFSYAEFDGTNLALKEYKQKI